MGRVVAQGAGMIVGSSQYNFCYGGQVHFGYSAACVISHARATGVPMTLLPTAVQRDMFNEHVDRFADADVLLCSCYVWNWEITNALAAAVKELNHHCVVIFGGPQVPDTIDAEWYSRHPWVDVCVHGEGEGAFEWLMAWWPDIRTGPGVSTKTEPTPHPRFPRPNLDAFDSPYVDGTIDELAEPLRDGRKWIAAFETTRGCPFGCTYCDWGSLTYSKLKQYPIERLNAEIEWFGERQIPYIDCCDANFGILPRDRDIARKLRETKERTGYPRTFRQSWTKNSTAKVIDIAKELHDGGLLTAAGLALESLDDATLKATKRKNLPFQQYADLSAQFAAAGLPTYTELIRGLPGETLASFKAGLGALIDDAHIGQIYVYSCGVLPNAPMAAPAYIAEHGIETVRSPIYLAHSAVGSRDVAEYEEIVVATKTMPRADMVQAFLYSWVVQLGECLGLCDQLSAWHADHDNVGRIAFYDALLHFCRTSWSVLAREYRAAEAYALRGYSGAGWDHYDAALGAIYWPIEESSWLRLVGRERSATANALTLLMRDLGHPSPAAAVKAQLDTLARFNGDNFAAWAVEVMWHGRRPQRFRSATIREAA